MAGRKTGITEWAGAANRAFRELEKLPKKQRRMALNLIAEEIDALDEADAKKDREAIARQVPMFGMDGNGSSVNGGVFGD